MPSNEYLVLWALLACVVLVLYGYKSKIDQFNKLKQRLFHIKKTKNDDNDYY
jgi:hypothetical protein